MENLSRRGFVGAAAAMAAVPAAASAFADEPAAEVTEAYGQIAIDEDIVAATGWAGTPKEIEQLGGSTMPLEAINMYRQKYLDLFGDHVCEDGTVIPAVFVKVRALINTYGTGWGHQQTDQMYSDIMHVMSEDDAQAFIDMPWGVEFRPLDMAAKTGRPVEQCAEICERLAYEGYLFRIETSAGNYYHQMAIVQGTAEIRMIRNCINPDYGPLNIRTLMADDQFELDYTYGGTYLLRTIPCDADLVVDSGAHPYDDIRQIIENQETFAIAPCACRYARLGIAGVEGTPSLEDFHTGEYADFISPIANRRVETCLHMGDEAKYHVSIGNAREITKEEALGFMQRSLEDGLMLQKLFSKDAQTVCSCENGACTYLAGFIALGAGAPTSRPFAQSRSSYELVVDYDSCAKCGMCAERCPMKVVYMDEETGLPTIGSEEIGELCFGCGQCAYVCPMGARTLVPRPAEELLELPKGILDDHNLKAAYRFEHGMMLL